MRRLQREIHRRIYGNLQLEFGEVTLTSYPSLELFTHYLRATRFNAAGREAFAGAPRWGDIGAVAMVRLLIGLLVVGGRRLRHLAYVQDDPLVQRLCGLRLIPTARTVSRWLQAFSRPLLARLHQLNTTVVAGVLSSLGMRTWTLDVDGGGVSTGPQVERAFRGFNPHHRKVPSYYPIVAHLAETTHILRVKNRSGNRSGPRFLDRSFSEIFTYTHHATVGTFNPPKYTSSGVRLASA